MLFLHYILKEDKDSMISKVFNALKEDSRRGDFVDLTTKDKVDLEIDLTNDEIESMSQWMWKRFLNNKIKVAAFENLKEENSTKEKTKNIIFNEFKMSTYLFENKKTSTSQIIFSVRSKTLDIKTWNPWKYANELCVMCSKASETMDHFISCEKYEDKLNKNWKNILSDNFEDQLVIGNFIEKRHKRRQEIIDQQEAGRDSEPGSTAPGDL